ncbi:dihydroneopterin aldolase [Hoeflea sp.]|uniref:dihydroneopterin aldolase n=1 Tax=Hoeflea sp. TaxID=1940281 RepID=UPI003A9525AB
MADNYIIRLVNCAFFAYHGVYDEEESLGQRFFVDAELEIDRGAALETDSLEGTVDYGVAFKVIEEVVTGQRKFLIEALALDVAKALTDRFSQIRRVRIALRKPGAPVQGLLDHVEVVVEHRA